MNHRRKTGLIMLGLAVAAVPTLAVAHTHYTGRVPASIAVDAMAAAPARPAVLKTTTPRVVRTASHKRKALAHKNRTVAHKKKAAVTAAAKHLAVAKPKHITLATHHKKVHAAKSAG